MRTLLTLARYKLLIESMRRPGIGLSYEIRVVIQGIITISLLEKAGVDPESEIQFLTDSALFDQFQVGTPTTRH